MDRVVKIWRVHDYRGQLLREDKPLYSSTLVHRSTVASVVWCVSPSNRVTSFPWLVRLSEDTLFTHCASTAFASRNSTRDEDDAPEEWLGCPGRIVILRWLGLNRFFPPTETRYQRIQRGCVSVSCVASTLSVLVGQSLKRMND